MLPATTPRTRRFSATSRDELILVEKEINSADSFSELVAAANLVEGIVGWYEKQRLRGMLDRAWIRFHRKCFALEPTHV